MRVTPLHTTLLCFCLLSFSSFIHPALATEGYWQYVGCEYSGFLNTLAGHAQWVYNHTRGPYDRWIVNLTISGYGFNPTTVVISDATGYIHMQLTGSTSQCQFVERVNVTLNAAVDLPHSSQWYFVMNNTGPVMLYFTLHLTLHHWSTNPLPQTPPDLLSYLSTLLSYFLVIGIIVMILVPCLCNCACMGRRRNRQRKSRDSDGSHPSTTYLVVLPGPFTTPTPVENEEDE